MSKLYTVDDLAKKYKLTAYTIRVKIKESGINRDATAKGRGAPALYYIKTVSPIFNKKHTCEHCKRPFSPVHYSDKYCSRTCYQHERNKRNRKTDRVHGKRSGVSYGDGGMVDFEGADRSYCTKKGREDMKKLRECSVDCLLSEFGDLE